MEEQKAASPDVFKKLVEKTKKLVSPTPEHEQDLFVEGTGEPTATTVPKPQREWSPEPRQKNGIKPCPYGPHAKLSDIRGCWLDPKCKA